jgi:hypothetical protein
VTLEILHILGHQISISTWTEISKLTAWGAISLAFWGSFRLAEILTKREGVFDGCTELLWEDLIFQNDGSLTIHIKSPKSAQFPGQFVDIFPLQNSSGCPIAILKQISKMQQQGGWYSLQKPPFSFCQDFYLTSRNLTSYMHALIRPVGILGPNDIITGHSLRAGIPSMLAQNPGNISEFEIQMWGRWSSEAYQAYLKLKSNQKKIIFQKIVHHIMK